MLHNFNMSFTFHSQGLTGCFYSSYVPIRWRRHEMWDNDISQYTTIPHVFSATCDDIISVNFGTGFDKWWEERYLTKIPEDIFGHLFKQDPCDSFPDIIMMKYETGGSMSLHVDRKKLNIDYRVILLAPKCSDKYGSDTLKYEGGELVVGDQEYTGSSNPDEWTWVTIPFGVKHEVKPVTSGTRYVVKVNIPSLPMIGNIEFKEDIFNGTATSYSNTITSKKGQINSLENLIKGLKMELKELEYLNDEDGRNDDENLEAIDILKKGEIVAVVLNGFYEKVDSLGMLMSKDRDVLANIVENVPKLKVSHTNHTISCFSHYESLHHYDDEYPEDMLKGHFSGSGDEDTRESPSQSGKTNVMETLDKIVSHVIINGDTGANGYQTFGVQQDETDSRYNDEYYSNFKVYNVSVLLLRV